MKRLALSAALVAVACGGDDGAVPDLLPSASGNWLAAVDDTTIVTLTLTEAASGALTGSGSVVIGTSGSAPFTVPDGQHDHPSISFDIAQPPAPANEWRGEFTTDDRFHVTEQRAQSQTLIFNRR